MNALVKLADREMAVETSMEVSNRVERLKKAVQAETNGACIERPMLWTKYHRNKANSDKTTNVKIAEAVRYVLNNKTVRIYDDELIVGNFTSKRVAGFSIQS